MTILEKPLKLSAIRSEERRVGKECRFKWSPYQAEDGIRDHCVTGVQTCALPISFINISTNLFYLIFWNITAYIHHHSKASIKSTIVSLTHFNSLNFWSISRNDYFRKATKAIFYKIRRASCRERV